MRRHEVNTPVISHTRLPPRALAVLAAIALLVAGHGTLSGHQGAEDDEPELHLRATPRVAFAPAEILVLGELRGGSDDHEQLYCASVEWDWDDGTRSESIPDCDPYEPGSVRSAAAIRCATPLIEAAGTRSVSA